MSAAAQLVGSEVATQVRGAVLYPWNSHGESLQEVTGRLYGHGLEQCLLGAIVRGKRRIGGTLPTLSLVLRYGGGGFEVIVFQSLSVFAV